MTAGERRALVVVAAVAAGFAAVVATGVADWLGGKPWFNSGANVLQWISGPGTFAAVAAGVALYFNRRCAAPRCVRLGEHPVDGTLQKVCDHHHTLAHHEAVYDRHADAHAASGRLDRGQSHDRAGGNGSAPQ